MQNFHVSATGHSVNYLPEYIATWQGYFAAEGLAVTAAVPSPWDLVLSDIGSGAAQARWAGYGYHRCIWGAAPATHPLPRSRCERRWR